MNHKPVITFLCTHNACRSQIAEALARKYDPSLTFCSAGTTPESRIDPTARRLMKTLYHIDMEKTQTPKSLSAIPRPDILISMGCLTGCPNMGRPFDEDWHLEDPAGKDEKVYLEVIREIDDRVKRLIRQLHRESL